MAKTPQIVGTVEAAEMLGVSQRRVNQLVQSGRLPAQKLGFGYAIFVSDLAKVKERKPGRPRKEKVSK